MPMRPQNVVKMMTGRAKEWAVMAWVRDAQVGYLIGTADSLSRCKSRQRAMRMRDEIPVREVLDQANLRIPEPHQQRTQPAHQLSLRTKGGTSEKPFP